MSMIERRFPQRFWLALVAVGSIVGLSAVHSLAGDETGKTKPDKEAIQGTWIAKSGETGGKKVGKDQVKKCKISFNGDKIEIVELVRGKGKGTFILDPTKKLELAEPRNENDQRTPS